MQLLKSCLHIIILISFLANHGGAQNQQSMQDFTPPCIRAELDQIAFLKGEWAVVSEKKTSFEADEWEESKAVASWTPLFNGCALQERWSGTLDGKPMEWIQLLVYNHRDQKWEQAMIDWAHGNLITSEGYYEEGKLIFTTPHMRRGKLLIDKTVIEQVNDDRVDWTIKTSLDGGESWIAFWKMQYRKK